MKKTIKKLINEDVVKNEKLKNIDYELKTLETSKIPEFNEYKYSEQAVKDSRLN